MRERERIDRVLAEFATPEALAEAVRALRERGFSRLDAYLPFPAHEVDEALGGRRSRLPLLLFAAGISAAAGAYALQWFLVAYLYPLNVGGRPPHFPLAFIPITFEMGVLFASLTAFGGVLVLGRLLRLTDEVQGTPGFESATRDRFWLEVGADDPALDIARLPDDLARLGASRVEWVGPEESRIERVGPDESRAEPDRAEPDRAEPDRADPDRADPDRAEPDRPEEAP